MLARVSNIEAYRQWRDTDDPPEALAERLTNFQPTEAMEAGTAFHKALEVAKPGVYDVLTANGYTFQMPEDCAMFLPSVRELRCYGSYGPLRVTGQVDALHGTRVEDHKTTAHLSAERYLDGCQWKFYLDLFQADVFRWNVFEVAPVRGQEKTYTVTPPHTLEAFRYAGLHDDCLALARGYYEFATKHLPQMEAA